jgi:hypothetical protein
MQSIPKSSSIVWRLLQMARPSTWKPSSSSNLRLLKVWQLHGSLLTGIEFTTLKLQAVRSTVGE